MQAISGCHPQPQHLRCWSPPWPSTWLKSDLLKWLHAFHYHTASNDAAFWPSPMTAAHELGCFHGALDAHSDQLPFPATFIEFSKSACLNDQSRMPFDDSGHNCPFKNGVETPWVLTWAKQYAQQGGDPGSQCARLMYTRNLAAS